MSRSRPLDKTILLVAWLLVPLAAFGARRSPFTGSAAATLTVVALALACAALVGAIVLGRVEIRRERLLAVGLLAAPVTLMLAALSGGLRSPALIPLAACAAAVSWGRRPRTAAVAAGVALLLLAAVQVPVAGPPRIDALLLAAATLVGLALLPSWMAARAAAPLAEARRRVDQLERFLGNARLTPEQPHLALGRAPRSPVSDETRDGRGPDPIVRLLRMVRDQAGAADAVFFRINRQRDLLEAVAWAGEGEAPADLEPEWQALVQWSARENVAQCDPGDAAPRFAVAPVPGERVTLGAICVVRAEGLALARPALMDWMPRYAAAVGAAADAADARVRFKRERRIDALVLEFIERFHRSKSRDELGEIVCEAVLALSAADRATIVRWRDGRGEVVSAAGRERTLVGTAIEAQSLVADICAEGLPQLWEDARGVTSSRNVFCARDGGGVVPSLAIYPLRLDERLVVGAVVAEGATPGSLGAGAMRALRNFSRYAAMSLETVWTLVDDSHEDKLTGLHNRRFFDDRIAGEFARHDRNLQTFSLLIADVDHFKKVNDTHGHEAGDAVLQAIAKVFADAVRTTDVCARFGGEEIAILLPETPLPGALELAERLRVAVAARPVMYAGREIRVTASFGVATFPHSARAREDFFPAADQALYRAKREGRNCVRYAPPILSSKTT